MIFVALGTHHQPFDRLVRAAEALARETGEAVVVQRGTSRCPAPSCEVVTRLAPDVFADHLRRARVVVIHAGSSSFLQARAAGRRPVVVPRSPQHGEHVDDHQIRFAAGLGDEAVVVPPEGVVAAVAAHVDSPRDVDPDARSAVFCARFGLAIDALLDGG